MNPFLKFFLALALTVIIGLAAFLVDGAPGSVASLQQKLETRVTAAHSQEAADWAQVKMDGQKAVLTGVAPNDQAREALIARIIAADGPGGLLTGGVTVVDASGLTVAKAPPLADPYTFIAELQPGTLVFSGFAPDQETRDAIYALARQVFPDTDISGSLDIASGAPADASSWRMATANAMRALSHLHHGAVAAEGARFSLTGAAMDNADLNAARQLIIALPAGFIGESNLNLSLPAPAPAPEAAPDTCGQLTQAASAISVTFAINRTEIDDVSQAPLRRLAVLLRDCPQARLKITGHTDSRGGAASNLKLSRERADAVGAFLISAAAPEDRIETAGAGETQPVASNATEAGRERNRRIEFEVILAN